MKDVVLHVYDVTSSGSEKANTTILQINRIFKDRIGLGGIFHSAIEVYGNEEWSFGFCEYGSGVFSCRPRRNLLYTYRESFLLGETNYTNAKVNQILRELRREWPGSSYDLLSKNCNHFCDVFCERLGVPKLPAWVNRFAHAGDAAMEAAENTTLRLKQAKEEIVSAGKIAYRYIAGVASHSPDTMDTASNSNQVVSSGFQGAWFRNLISSVGAKPSSSTPEIRDETRSPISLQRSREPDQVHHRRESSI